MSLPMWERGLKHPCEVVLNVPSGVAPHVGVWIETTESPFARWYEASLPMWERGLKRLCGLSCDSIRGRSPCGSVD